MVSKYDEYWGGQLAELARLLGEAYADGVSSELDVSGIREYGNGESWYGTFVTRPDGTTSNVGAHSTSLRDVVLANRLLEPYHGLGFRFTITPDLKLSVRRLAAEAAVAPTPEDALARIEALEQRVAALEERAKRGTHAGG